LSSGTDAIIIKGLFGWLPFLCVENCKKSSLKTDVNSSLFLYGQPEYALVFCPKTGQSKRIYKFQHIFQKDELS